MIHADPMVTTQAAQHIPNDLDSGIAEGALVITLDGMRRVEDLQGGERIVTRSGARQLRDVRMLTDGYALVFAQPEIVYLSDRQVHSETGMAFAA